MSQLNYFCLPLPFTSADGKVTAALAITCSVVVCCLLLAYQNCRILCHFSCRKPTRQHDIMFEPLFSASSSFTSHNQLNHCQHLNSYSTITMATVLAHIERPPVNLNAPSTLQIQIQTPKQSRRMGIYAMEYEDMPA